MKRPAKGPRRRPVVESLETRTLMSGIPDAMSPLPNTGPTTSIFVRFVADEPEGQQKADLKAIGATVITSYTDGPELISLGRGVTPDAAIQRLQGDSGVVYASDDSTIHASSVPIYTNDTALPQLWGLNNVNNVDIDAPEAYGVTIGNTSTIVAVLDTGIDLNNPDFTNKIWTNPGNDAAEGYPNDIHGWNFIDNTSNVQDNDGHGTHVSAVIAAVGNNNYGVIGVDPSAQIMPLKFLDANGNGSTDAAVSAIYFAVNHGAKVINASWGGVDFSAPLRDAIAYANSRNVVFVTAAGNDGTNNDVVPSFPASFREPNELSVASVDRFGNLASFSNDGASTVDLAAPGVDIISDVPTSIDPSGLQDLSGTSMSTAYVSGVAALVSGLNPLLTATQIVKQVDSTTKPLPSLYGKTISGGMVDAYNAVTAGVFTATTTTTITATPTAGGLPILVPGASTDADVHSSILASGEYYDAHGGTSQGFVTGLYVDLLGRFPDASGLQSWVTAAESGTVSRFTIAETILTSPEGRETEVARWFQTDLGRTATLDNLKVDPGVDAWANLLVGGLGDNTVEAAIMSSPEFLAKNGEAPLPIVAGYYQDLADRAADSGGQTAWAALFGQGLTPDQVLRMFQASAEVQQTKVARWFIEDLGRTSTVADLKNDSGVQGWASDLGNS